MCAKKALFAIMPCVLLMGAVVFSAGCSSENEIAYLTPLPEATITAYQLAYPIRTNLDAAIAARRNIDTTRISPVGSPKAISVEHMTLAEAAARIPQLYTRDHPADAKVWLVIFQGKWELLPPEAAAPLPAYDGCVGSLFFGDEPGFMVTGDMACPP